MTNREEKFLEYLRDPDLVKDINDRFHHDDWQNAPICMIISICVTVLESEFLRLVQDE